MRFEIARTTLTTTIIETLRQQNKGRYPDKIYVTNTEFTDDQGQECQWVHLLIGSPLGFPRYQVGISLVEQEPAYIEHLQKIIERRD